MDRVSLLLPVVLFLFQFVHCRNAVIENNKLFVNGVPFFVKGINYSPTPLGMASVDSNGYGGGGYCSSRMTPYGEWKSACYDSDFFDASPDHYTRWPPGPSDGFAALWRRDFPVMKAMGANLLRIYNANPTTRAMSQLYSNIIPYPQGKDHVPFLNYAEQTGFYVMFPLYGDFWAFSNTPVNEFKRFLRAQIDEVGNHSAVLIWQFGNEMNWDGVHLGFYPYPDLVAKYNMYVQYIRQYTFSRWGRRIPVTHGLCDFPQTYDWLIQRLDVDIFSVNIFRGTSTTDLFQGRASVTAGFKYNSCAWNKPILISEFGFPNYGTGQVNQLISDFVSHMSEGLIGVALFELNDEPFQFKDGGSRTYGAQSVTVNVSGTIDSTMSNAFLLDIYTPKQILLDVTSGLYNNVAYNFRADLLSLSGQPAQILGKSTDNCRSVATFYNCPGGNYPACNGHGICNRIAGTCTCADGWNGLDCATPVCNCNGRGTCSSVTSPPQCVCNTGYYGANCESTLTSPRQACPNGCTSGNGVCNQTDYLCACVKGWIGLDCSVVSVPVPPTLPPTPAPTPPPVMVCATNVAEDGVVAVRCPVGQIITSVQFASYGTPTGTKCGEFAVGTCHASTSLSVSQTQCLNRNNCSFSGSNGVFGDPCYLTLKRFSLQVLCTTPVPTV